jgi:hypothetical protein
MSCSCSPDFLIYYKKCLKSQKTYCKRFGYDYVIDNSPLIEGQTNKEWTWKKHYTLDQYVDTHDILILIDADCEIKNNAPPIESFLDDNSIYYVNGVSKRPNAGFMVFRNNEIRKKFHQELMTRRYRQVPNQYRVKSGGDNGHVIWILDEMNENKKELPLAWNCSQPEYVDSAYIIHYTNHMRNFYKREIL